MKIELDNNIKQNIFFQLVFWPALFLFAIVRDYGDYEPSEFMDVVIYNFCHWIFQIFSANFIYYILFRRFFDQKNTSDFQSVFYSVFILFLSSTGFLLCMRQNLFLLIYLKTALPASLQISIIFWLIILFPLSAVHLFSYPSCFLYGIKMKNNKR